MNIFTFRFINLLKNIMKKFISTTLFFLITLNLLVAQKKNEEIFHLKAGPIDGGYKKLIDIDKQDTLHYIYLGFQNQKYQSITDIKSIMITKKVILDEFQKDLKTAYKEMLKGEKISLAWEREDYKLNLYDFTKSIYISEGKGTGGYTILSKNQLATLIELLYQIDLGKDETKTALPIGEILEK